MPATVPHSILRVVLPYAAFAALWIYTSDALLARWAPDLATLMRLQTFKGFAFIVVTAVLLYVLLRRELGLRARADSDRTRTRARLVDVLESVTEGFVSLDHSWRFTYVNQRAADMLGRPAKHLIGQNIWEQFPQVVGHSFARAFEKAMTERVAQTIDDYYPARDRWFENRVYPTPEGVAILFRDITDRIRADEQLGETEERFRATFEQAAVGIAHVAPDGRWLRMNRRLCDIVGYSAEELLTRTFQDLTHPDDLDIDLDHQRRLLAGDIEMYTMEKRYFRKDGSVVWITLTVSLVRDAAGGPKYLIKVVEDISRRREAETALRRSEERFRCMAESTAAAIFIVQGERLRFVNPQASRLTGYTHTQLLEMDAWTVIHPRFRSEVQSRAASRLRGEDVSAHFELVLVRSDGAERWVDMSATVIESDDKPAILGTAYDITERKEAEAALLRAHDELEQHVADRTRELERTNAALQTFTYMVSHDLRTPLRAMQGFARALLEDHARALPADGQDYAQRIAGAAARMDTLIQDLLAYSKIELAPLTLAPVDLGSAVASALTTLGSDIRARGASVETAIANSQVRAERPILIQVIGNLVSNAVKFTAPNVAPQIQLQAARCGEWVRLSVVDNGIGIAPEQHERIFKPFERLHGIETYPGTGIGLAIAQKAIERMGGTIGVESHPGRGSCFWIELPLADGEASHDA